MNAVEKFKSEIWDVFERIMTGTTKHAGTGECWIQRTSKGVEMSDEFAQLLIERRQTYR